MSSTSLVSEITIFVILPRSTYLYQVLIYFFAYLILGSKAIDSLLESKWVTNEKLFTTRQEIEGFLDL